MFNWFSGFSIREIIAIMEKFQTKVLRAITNETWFINKDIYRDLNLPSVSETIAMFSKSNVKRLEEHTNPLAINCLLYTSRCV